VKASRIPLERDRQPRTAERKLGADDLALWMRHVARTDALSPVQKTLIIVIASYDWPNVGVGCIAGTATLAAAVPCERKTVIRHIAALCARGLLVKTRRPGTSDRGGRLTNVLTVNRKACVSLPLSRDLSPVRGTQLGLSTTEGEGLVPQAGPNLVPPGVQEVRAGETRQPNAAPSAGAALRGAPTDAANDAGASPERRGLDLMLLELAKTDPAARQRAVERGLIPATALPGGAGAGSAPVASASPAPDASAPELAPPAPEPNPDGGDVGDGGDDLAARRQPPGRPVDPSGRLLRGPPARWPEPARQVTR